MPLISGPYHCLCSENSTFLPKRLPPSVLKPPPTTAGEVCPCPSYHFILSPFISSSSSGGQGALWWGLPFPTGAPISGGVIGLDAMPSLHCPYLSPPPWAPSRQSASSLSPKDQVSRSGAGLEGVGCGARLPELWAPLHHTLAL